MPRSTAKCPEPQSSPFMRRMDSIERTVKQIVMAHRVLADLPRGILVPAAVVQALKDVADVPADPACLDDLFVALTRLVREATIVGAKHRLKATGVSPETESLRDSRQTPPPCVPFLKLRKR